MKKLLFQNWLFKLLSTLPRYSLFIGWGQQNIDFKEDDIDLKSYAWYIFKEGTNKQKAEFIKGLGIPLYLYNKKIYTEPINIK